MKRLAGFLIAAAVAVGCAPSAPVGWRVGTLAGSAGVSGAVDGPGIAARFNYPHGVTVGAGGSIFVTDEQGQTIRRVEPNGETSTFAGTAGSAGSANGTGTSARFNGPAGIAADMSGNLYVADGINNTIRKVTPAGAVTTLAGSPGQAGSVDGTGSAARFNKPDSVAVDAAGNVFVADTYNSAIRKITPSGAVTTIAGTPGIPGTLDGTPGQFSLPRGIAINRATNELFVADTYNHTIRKIAPDGTVSTIAGLAGAPGSTDGPAPTSRFNEPFGIATDPSGNLFVADTFNHTIRKIDPTAQVSTIAGIAGVPGFADGSGPGAQFDRPYALAVTATDSLVVADTYNHTVRTATSR